MSLANAAPLFTCSAPVFCVDVVTGVVVPCTTNPDFTIKSFESNAIFLNSFSYKL
jgi:hypothetical protein